MRILVIVGVILVGLGVAAFMGVLEFPRKKEVLSIGEFKASVEETVSVPPWVGVLAMVLGAGLVAGGLTRKR